MTKIRSKGLTPRKAWNSWEGFHQFYTGNTGPLAQRYYGSFEVFWHRVAPVGDDASGLAQGWYWWACFPGCLPDGEPEGPYVSSNAAYRAAQEGGSLS